jgi:hypothetical protein
LQQFSTTKARTHQLEPPFPQTSFFFPSSHLNANAKKKNTNTITKASILEGIYPNICALYNLGSLFLVQQYSPCLKYLRSRTSKPPRKSTSHQHISTQALQTDRDKQYSSKYSCQQCSDLFPCPTARCWHHQRRYAFHICTSPRFGTCL